MTIRAGTSGFSYKEWKGTFYPADLRPADMLAYYAAKLPAVEINNTFYRMPKVEVLESWADQVSPGFRFVLKASRRITHFKRLKDVDAELRYFLGTAAVLGDKLGAVLFQLPPNMSRDLDRLDAFLGLLGDPRRAAFEFRHASWMEPAVMECLRSHGASLCIADTEEADATIVETGPLGYLRLRRPDYGDGDLSRWAGDVATAGWESAFVFFKHEDAGAGPRMARRFMEIAEEDASA